MMNNNFDFFVIHLNSDDNILYRTETLVVPNNTVISLVEILHHNGISYDNCYAYDQGIDTSEQLYKNLFIDIDMAVKEGKIPILLFSLLVYNAKESIDMVLRLRTEFGKKLKIILGGQLVTQMNNISTTRGMINPYSQYADSVACGDGELIIPELLASLYSQDLQLMYNKSYGGTESNKRFSTISVNSQKTLYGIEDRLIKMKELAGFSQLSVQGKGGPGCWWAITNKACEFCALTSITVNNDTDLNSIIEQSFELKKYYNIDRIFDVSNQFIPHSLKLRKDYLRDYSNIVRRFENKYNVIKPDLFVYLTLSSLLDEDTVSLLSDCGVRHTYVGFEHLDSDILHNQGKPVQRKALDKIHMALDLCKKYGIKVNGGFVLGSPLEKKSSLNMLRDGFKQIVDKYCPDVLVQFGFYPVELLPGSQYFKDFMEDVYNDNIDYLDPIKDIFDKLLQTGYWTREEQKIVTKIFINNYSGVDYEDVLSLSKELENYMRDHGGIGYRIDDGDDKNKLKKYCD